MRNAGTGTRHASCSLCPHRRRLRHRRHRIRHHGPAAGRQRRSRRLDLRGRACSFPAMRSASSSARRCSAPSPAAGPKKTLLMSLMVVFTVGNLACALAPDYWTLMAARVLTAFAHGSFFGIGSVVATGLVAGEQEGLGHRPHVHRPDRRQHPRRAASAPWLGQAYGWRSTFWAVDAGRRSSALAVIALLVPRDSQADEAEDTSRRRARRPRPARGSARPADHGARLGRRLRRLHLHRADPDPASPVSPRPPCRRSCSSSAAGWSSATCSAARLADRRLVPTAARQPAGALAPCSAP